MNNTFRFLTKTARVRAAVALMAVGAIAAAAPALHAQDRARKGVEKHPSGHDRIPMQVTKNLKIAYQVSDDAMKGDVSRALYYAKKLLDTYKASGVPDREIDLHLVFHGKATNALVNDATRKRLKAAGTAANPNLALVKELTARGVSIELCESSMEQRDVEPADLLTGVATVRGAFPRLINLQHLGYAYIKFE